VFFSDLVGYTSISEALKERPEQLVELVNGYFSVMVSIIERHGGYVDKFIGDAVMAVWGAPLPEAEQEKKAVSAALACVEALQRFNADVVVGTHKLPPIGARIGINTGEAIVGNMGSPERLNYTVTGDTVNLASRLEGANKTYGTSIMIGPGTAEAVRDGFVLRPLDLLAVKGKKIPVQVYDRRRRRGCAGANCRL
jgi:adenylate cyclase